MGKIKKIMVMLIPIITYLGFSAQTAMATVDVVTNSTTGITTITDQVQVTQATSGTRYRTIGFTTRITTAGKTYSARVKYSSTTKDLGTELLVTFTAPYVSNPVTNYSVYTRLMQQYTNATDQNNIRNFVLKGGQIELDAVMTIIEDGVAQGSMDADGTLSGEVYTTLSGISGARYWRSSVKDDFKLYFDQIRTVPPQSIVNPPNVINVSSTTANGAYNAGKTVVVTVQFDEPVLVSGTPSLKLSVGNTRYATYPGATLGGNGVDTIKLYYKVQSGDNTPDLDYTSTSALAGTIKDKNGNSAVLTLAAPKAAKSLSYNKNIEIDTKPPIIASSYPAKGATSVPLSPIISATFDENVTASTAFNNILLRNSSGTLIPFTKSLTGKILTMVPSQALGLNTSYTVTIPDNAVIDNATNGVKLYEFSFSTGDSISLCPAPDATIVSGAEYVAKLPDLYGTKVGSILSNSPQIKNVKSMVDTIYKLTEGKQSKPVSRGETRQLRKATGSATYNSLITASISGNPTSWTTSATLRASSSGAKGTVTYTWTTQNVTSNGSYSVTVTDKYSVTTTTTDPKTGKKTTTTTQKTDTATASATVSKIDTTGPYLVSTTLTPSGNTNGSVTIKVTMADSGIGVDYTTLTRTVTTNGSYTLTGYDRLGNKTDFTVNVTNIDTSPPTVDPYTNPPQGTWTAGNVTVYAGASDTGTSGINTSTYSWSNGLTTPSFTVSSNSFIYWVTVYDKAGNKSNIGFTYVANIDKTAPILSSLTVDPPNSTWANKKTITVSSYTEDQSGLYGGRWQHLASGLTGTFTGSSFDIYKNGTYRVWIKDNVGNEGVYKDVAVDLIDIEIPTIQIKTPITDPNLRRYTNKNYFLDVIATEANPTTYTKKSDLARFEWAYNQTTAYTVNTFPGGTTLLGFTSPLSTYTSKFEAFNSGYYTIYVKDRAGNAAVKIIKINNIDKTPPEGAINIKGTEPTNTYTKSPYVDIDFTISATDPFGNISSVGACIDSYRISSDPNFAGASWQFAGEKATSISWTEKNFPLPNPTQDGEKVIYFEVKDITGNSKRFEDKIILDATMPDGSVLINGGSQYANRGPLSVVINGTDNLCGISKYFVLKYYDPNQDVLEPDETTPGWISITPTTNLSTVYYMAHNSPDAIVSSYIWLMDRAGNISNMLQDDIMFDATPLGGQVLIDGGAARTIYPNVMLNFVQIPTIPNLADAQTIIISSDPSFNPALGTVWTVPYNDVIYNWPLDTTSHGSRTVYAKYIDYAGNVSNIFSDTVVYPGPIIFSKTIDHKQIIRVGTSQVAVSDPNTIVSGTVPSGQKLSQWNTFIDYDYLKYRLEFDVATKTISDKMKDLSIELSLNDDNNDDVDLLLGKDASGNTIPNTYVTLKKFNGSTYQTIKDINLGDPASFRRIGRNKYEITIGKDNAGNPMMVANGPGSYALEYQTKLNIRKNYYIPAERGTSIKNTASLKVHLIAGQRFPRVVEPEAPGHKFDITTNITRDFIRVQ